MPLSRGYVVLYVFCFIISTLQFSRCKRSPRARARSGRRLAEPTAGDHKTSVEPSAAETFDSRLEAPARASIHEIVEAFMLGLTPCVRATCPAWVLHQFCPNEALPADKTVGRVNTLELDPVEITHRIHTLLERLKRPRFVPVSLSLIHI